MMASMGIVALVAPRYVFTFFGAEAQTADIRNEIRAVYGGFGLAMAAVLIVTRAGDLAAGVQLTIAIALLGMAAGRVVAFFLERTGPWPWVFLVSEAVVGVLLWPGATLTGRVKRGRLTDQHAKPLGRAWP